MCTFHDMKDSCIQCDYQFDMNFTFDEMKHNWNEWVINCLYTFYVIKEFFTPPAIHYCWHVCTSEWLIMYKYTYTWLNKMCVDCSWLERCLFTLLMIFFMHACKHVYMQHVYVLSGLYTFYGIKDACIPSSLYTFYDIKDVCLHHLSFCHGCVHAYIHVCIALHA